jgi:hypothetical protein
MSLTQRTIASQPCWVLRGKDVELAVTKLGAHMAPVTFYRRDRGGIRPYYVSPWQDEGQKIAEPVLVPLRGDFFCMPFGANSAPYRGQKYDLHGEPAGRKWALSGTETVDGVSTMSLRMKTRLPEGEVRREFHTVDGQNVIYTREVLSGYSARVPLGHHATLAMPEKEGSVLVATSGIRYGSTNPTPTGDPAKGEYQSSAPDRRFKSLSRVPLLSHDPRTGDFSAFPTRRGYTDLAAVFHRPGVGKPAWTTATFTTEGYLWFALKDPDLLPTTLLWVSNRGRHFAPWDSRNCCLGLEDVCGFFAEGIAPSLRANFLSRDGIATCVRLSPKQPTEIRYVQGVVRVPRGFGRVRSAKFSAMKVAFKDTSGKTVEAPVNHRFLWGGAPSA